MDEKGILIAKKNLSTGFTLHWFTNGSGFEKGLNSKAKEPLR